MKKKGFMLIELLAVIVILGIILIISVPVITNIIENSKKGAFKVSVLNIFEAYEIYEAKHQFDINDKIDIKDLPITNPNTFLSGIAYKDNGIITIENVSDGTYSAEGTKENVRIVNGSYEVLDKTPPIIINITSEVTTNSIKLYTTYIEEESFIGKHEYRIVKEGEDIEDASWVNGDSLTENLSIKILSNLEPGISYKIQVRLTNISLENNVSEIKEILVTTESIEKPLITILTDKEYATSKEIKITYPEGSGLTYEYSLDGITWNSTSEREKIITIEENGMVRARVDDGITYVYADSLTINGIDTTKPSVTITRNTVENRNVLVSSIEPSDTISGYAYTWYKDGNIISGEITSTLIVTTSGTYSLKVVTGAGIESISNEIITNTYSITYNLNGGTGSIGSQTKIEDIELNLTSTIPIREGYSFIGWGLTSRDKTVTYTSGGNYTKNESITLYAIWKKVYTITFVGNGATLSETTKSCEIYNEETSCSVTTPNVTRSGYTIIGYGESSTSKTSVIGSNSTLSVNENKTYYAVTSKVFTANFHKNTVSSISSTSSTCTIYNMETSCSPTLPIITVQTNFTSQGWGTTAEQASAGTTSITLNESNSGSTWYALNSRTLTWNFNKGSVSGISKTVDGCTIWNTSATCTISAPTITPVNGYTQNGFGTTNTETSAIVAQSGTITLSNSSTGGTYYGLQKKTITISYDGNGATSGSTAAQTCTMYNANTGCAVTLNNNGFIRIDYEFLGWGAGKDIVTYNAGASYTYGSNATFYAIWKQTPKTFTNVLSNSEDVASNDPDKNLRYVGENPNNYVYFNNELWRIIGVFNGQAKIIRVNSYNSSAWDVNGINDWKASTIKEVLNTTFYTSIENISKSYIDENHVWQLGKMDPVGPTWSTTWALTNIYAAEKNNSSLWTGSIGLMYISDYGYSAISCTNLSNYSQGCEKSNWLYVGLGEKKWTITSNSNNSEQAYYITALSASGNIWTYASSSITTNSAEIYPTLYLKENVLIATGTGTSDDPFILTQ